MNGRNRPGRIDQINLLLTATIDAYNAEKENGATNGVLVNSELRAENDRLKASNNVFQQRINQLNQKIFVVTAENYTLLQAANTYSVAMRQEHNDDRN